jgi:type II secretory pathway pseudopilin PulG
VRRGDSGAALLEVVVAVAVLTAAGVAAVTAAAESARAVAHARAADEEARAASAFLDAVALWTRTDLDRRLGERAQGPWLLRVGRPERELYTVELADSTGRAVLLRTSLFRPDTAASALP